MGRKLSRKEELKITLIVTIVMLLLVGISSLFTEKKSPPNDILNDFLEAVKYKNIEVVKSYSSVTEQMMIDRHGVRPKGLVDWEIIKVHSQWHKNSTDYTYTVDLIFNDDKDREVVETYVIKMEVSNYMRTGKVLYLKKKTSNKTRPK